MGYACGRAQAYAYLPPIVESSSAPVVLVALFSVEHTFEMLGDPFVTLKDRSV